MSTLLDLRGIVKQFPGLRAVNDVDLKVHSGEIHGLVGANGAGKSTLIKILAGVHRPDEGEIVLNGSHVDISNPHDAIELGVSTIHQELAVAPELTALENVFLGREFVGSGLRRRLGMLDFSAMRRELGEMYLEFGLSSADLDREVGLLSPVKRHGVIVLRAMVLQASVVIMDEPTSGLGHAEAQALVEHMHRMVERGVGVIWVTHSLRELVGVADRVSVLRDGQNVGEVRNPQEADIPEIVQLMVGRQVASVEEVVSAGRRAESEPAESSQGPGSARLECVDVSTANALTDVSFALHNGEIVGVTGLEGSGHDSLSRVLLGLDDIVSGDFYLDGRRVQINCPRDAYRLGIGLVPPDRKTNGIFETFSVTNHITLSGLDRITGWGGVLNRPREAILGQEAIKRFGIRANDQHQAIETLSGGNQQKVLVARSFFSEPQIMIFDEPTEGVDIGAKEELYGLVTEFAKEGGATLVTSVDIAELLGLCDRILVMAKGRVVSEYKGIGRCSTDDLQHLETELLAVAAGSG